MANTSFDELKERWELVGKYANIGIKAIDLIQCWSKQSNNYSNYTVLEQIDKAANDIANEINN